MQKNLKTFLLYILYLIIILEIFLRLPFFYNKIFQNFSQKPTKFIWEIPKVPEDGIVLYWKFNNVSSFELIYPKYNLLSSKDETIKAKINKIGFRGSVFDIGKKPKTLRIVFLGDSFTFGWGLPDGETYPEKVCVELKKQLPSKDFECLNFGMFGYNIFNTYNVFKDLVIKYNPDLVIFGLTINDVEKNLFYISENMKIERQQRVVDLFEGAPTTITFEDKILAHSYIYRLIAYLYYVHKLKEVTINYYHSLYGPVNERWLYINTDALIKIKKETDSLQIPLLCLYFPVLYKLKSGYPLKKFIKCITIFLEKTKSLI